MKRILLTGMSGVGKSSVVRELLARGFKAVDTDDGWSEPRPDGRQRWREDAIESLLGTEDAEVLFIAGCEENQAKFHPQFDFIILLSAPLEVLIERLATRTNNPYGKKPDELRRIHSDVETIEPLLRQAATHEISTTMPLEDVVRTVLRLVDEAQHSSVARARLEPGAREPGHAAGQSPRRDGVASRSGKAAARTARSAC